MRLLVLCSTVCSSWVSSSDWMIFGFISICNNLSNKAVCNTLSLLLWNKTLYIRFTLRKLNQAKKHQPQASTPGNPTLGNRMWACRFCCYGDFSHILPKKPSLQPWATYPRWLGSIAYFGPNHSTFKGIPLFQYVTLLVLLISTVYYWFVWRCQIIRCRTR